MKFITDTEYFTNHIFPVSFSIIYDTLLNFKITVPENSIVVYNFIPLFVNNLMHLNEFVCRRTI